jgi:hypothetical protein
MSDRPHVIGAAGTPCTVVLEKHCGLTAARRA